MQPTGICGGEIGRENNVDRAAYPGRLIAAVTPPVSRLYRQGPPSTMLQLILVLVVTLPIAWLASEFMAKTAVRVGLGVAAIAMSFAVAWIVGSLDRLQSNTYFGDATKDLIQNTIVELENGNADRVLLELKNLRSQFHPNYETRDDYDRLVAKYVNAVADSPVIHERGVPGWADEYVPQEVTPDQSEEGVTRP
jgi:hypothetical protein